MTLNFHSAKTFLQHNTFNIQKYTFEVQQYTFKQQKLYFQSIRLRFQSAKTYLPKSSRACTPKMAGPIRHRREKEMKREQIAKYIHEI